MTMKKVKGVVEAEAKVEDPAMVEVEVEVWVGVDNTAGGTGYVLWVGNAEAGTVALSAWISARRRSSSA